MFVVIGLSIRRLYPDMPSRRLLEENKAIMNIYHVSFWTIMEFDEEGNITKVNPAEIMIPLSVQEFQKY